MNQQLIIALAVCLVSVHAFVKREAPTTEGTIESISKTAGDWLKGFQETAARVINPEEVKKHLDTAFRTASEMAKKAAAAINSNKNATNTP